MASAGPSGFIHVAQYKLQHVTATSRSENLLPAGQASPSSSVCLSPPGKVENYLLASHMTRWLGTGLSSAPLATLRASSSDVHSKESSSFMRPVLGIQEQLNDSRDLSDFELACSGSTMKCSAAQARHDLALPTTKSRTRHHISPGASVSKSMQPRT